MEIWSILVNDSCRNLFSTNREPPKISTNQNMERIERNEWDIGMFWVNEMSGMNGNEFSFQRNDFECF